jgi:hypothetical protein
MAMRHHKVGALSISKVFEMDAGLPLSMVMPQATVEDLARMKRWYWDETLSDDPAQASFMLSFHSYVLQVDGRNILIDSCCGNHKNRQIPDAHQLNLPGLKISPRWAWRRRILIW